MIQKKVCMIGTFAVGKTSLVRRFVESIFSDKYLTTVGVKITKKVVSIEDRQIRLILWDLNGEDEFQRLQESYLRGSAGYILTADGTRSETIEKAVELQQRVQSVTGPVPFVLALNKWDLQDEWEVTPSQIDDFQKKGWLVQTTSAKNGWGVDTAFANLGEHMLNK